MAVAAALAVTWRLSLPGGGEVIVTSPTVLGRNPRRVPQAPGAQTVSLQDPESSVSKTHALLVPSGGSLRVTDLHSTNGVAVISPGGGTRVLESGGSAELQTGAVLELGRYRMTVARA